MADSIARLTAALADRYRVERELGAGGMATVYLADDLKHDRKVALKVLKPELAAVLGADRFVQEIKTTASLQHPNILPLFDSGEADGFLFYVMPYIEGETLREKLDRETQLGVEEAVRITTEVADALDYAHRQRVIHRDIKPENILLNDGRPMVADFGIALAVSAAAGGRMTETGLSLGTPHYMSPEQATAEKNVTHRSDIYSLGCVIYEMLAGDPPHTGSSAQAIILKIITDEARPVTELRKSVPANVAAALAMALERLPADRFESVSEFAQALSDSSFSSSGNPPGTAAIQRQTLAVSVLGIVAIVTTLFGAWGWLRQPQSSATSVTTRFVENLGNLTLGAGPGRLFDIGPDGSLVIVGTDSTGVSQLFLRRGNAVGMVPVPETQGAEAAVFSPDGQWMAFTQEDDLKKVPVVGGTPQLIARDARAMELHWGAGDQIAFVESGQGARGVFLVAAAGGRPTLVPGTDTTAARLVWPEVLPDGRTALVTLFPRLEDAQIGVLDLLSGDIKLLAVDGTHAHYLPTGHLTYGHPDGGVFAVPFDLATGRVTGDPVSVLEDVSVYGGSSMFGGGATQFAVSHTGYIATLGTAGARLPLLDVDFSGVAVPLPVQAASYPGPQYSPDGRFIAFEDGSMGSGRDIYVYDRELDTRSRLTHTGDLNRYATWSHDGVWIYFLSRGEHSRYLDLYRRRADRSAPAEHLAAIAGSEAPQAVLPDGRMLVRTNSEVGEGRDLVIVTPGDRVPIPFLENPWDEFGARLSPDGRWVAHTSNETGSNEVYVTSFPTPSSIVKVSQGGGSEAVWSPDGGRLFYWAGASLMAATVTTGTEFGVTGRSEVFSGAFARYVLFPQYDIHPDGKSFVMFGGTQETANQIVVAVNWFSEVRERMGER